MIEWFLNRLNIHNVDVLGYALLGKMLVGSLGAILLGSLITRLNRPP